MDTLTHYLTSWLIGKNIEFKKDHLRPFLIGSIIPDIDAFTIFLGYGFFNSFHATITHSIFTGIIFAIIISLFMKKFYPGNASYREIFNFAYAGFLLHNLIDIIFNSNFFLAVKTLGVDAGGDLPHITGGNTIFWPVSDIKAQLYLHFEYSILIPFTATIVVICATYYFVVRRISRKDHPWDIWIK